ncbi:septum site-determining protein Ssd [Amycolatopsis anabasis]|uniref:septum site-determining protein Ssd n=1 Tax=Amycolatopsis anabasis TaxID=1840409 RepID=UPI00131C762A|nr:septum site-determining protein Ssd [Amycolatopsis anabasis]
MTENRPLVVGCDDTVIEEILRLAAAVGCDTERAPDLVAARGRWAHAPLVLLDEHVVRVEPELPRRRGVFLVSKGPPAPETWQRAFEAGVERVVTLPEGEDGLIAELAEVVEGPGVEGGCVVGVLGGRGGAGASVLAASIGLTAAREGPALLVDCDPLGGGIDLLLGAELDGGLRWPALRVGSGRVSMPALHSALPERRHGDGRLSFISCDRESLGPTAQAVKAVVEAGRRSGRVVVCDLPRQLGAGAAAAADQADLLVLVVPAEVRACLAAKCVLHRLGEREGRVRVVVRGPAPDGLDAEYVADVVGVPLIADMPAERGLAKALERGEFAPRPRGPLATAAQAVLTAARSGRSEAGAPR